MKNTQHIQKSLFTALIILIAYEFITWMIIACVSVVNDLATLIQYTVSCEKNTAVIISLACIVIILWLLGYIQIRKIVVYIFKKKAKNTKEKFFCARLKNPAFLGGYHIGIVTNQSIVDGRKCYTMVFNIAGLMTVPNVLEEDIERVDMSITDWGLLYLTFGVM